MRCVVLTGCFDKRRTCGIFPHTYRKCVKVWGVKVCSLGTETRGGSEHDITAPIWVGGQFRPVRVRLIGGDTELLLEMEIITELRITVGFGNRNFHVGRGEWRATTRIAGILWVFPLPPTARGYTKLENYCAEIKNAIYQL